MKIKKIVAILLLTGLGLTACNDGGSRNNNTNEVAQQSKPGLKVNNLPENFVIADAPNGMRPSSYTKRVKVQLMSIEANLRKFMDAYQGVKPPIDVWIQSREHANIERAIQELKNLDYEPATTYEIYLRGMDANIKFTTERWPNTFSYSGNRLGKKIISTLNEMYVTSSKDPSVTTIVIKNTTNNKYEVGISKGGELISADMTEAKAISKIHGPQNFERAVLGGEPELTSIVEANLAKQIRPLEKQNEYTLIATGVIGAGIGLAYWSAFAADSISGTEGVDALNQFFVDAGTKIMIGLQSNAGQGISTAFSTYMNGQFGLSMSLGAAYAISAIADASGQHGKVAKSIKFGNDITGASLLDGITAKQYEKGGLGASIVSGFFYGFFIYNPAAIYVVGPVYGSAYAFGYLFGVDDQFANEITEKVSSAFQGKSSEPDEADGFNIRYTQYKPIRPNKWEGLNYSGDGLASICFSMDDKFLEADTFNNEGKDKLKNNTKKNYIQGNCSKYSPYSNLITPSKSARSQDETDFSSTSDFVSQWDVMSQWKSDGFNSFKFSAIGEISGGYCSHCKDNTIPLGFIVPGLNGTDTSINFTSWIVDLNKDLLDKKGAGTYRDGFIKSMDGNDQAMATIYKESGSWVAYSSAYNGKTLAVSRFVMPNLNLSESSGVINAYDPKELPLWHDRPLNLVTITNLAEIPDSSSGPSILKTREHTYLERGNVEVFTQSSPGTSILQIVEDPKRVGAYEISPKFVEKLYDAGQDCPSLSKVCFSKVSTTSEAGKAATFIVAPTGTFKHSNDDYPKAIKKSIFSTSGFGYVRFIVKDPRSYYINEQLESIPVGGSDLVAFRVTLPIRWESGSAYIYAPNDSLANVDIQHVVYNTKTLTWDNDTSLPVVNYDTMLGVSYDGEHGVLTLNMIDLTTLPVGGYRTDLTQSGQNVCTNPAMDDFGELTANCAGVTYHLPYEQACKAGSKVGVLYSYYNNTKTVLGLKCDDPALPNGTYLNDIAAAFVDKESDGALSLYLTYKSNPNYNTGESEYTTFAYSEQCAAGSAISLVKPLSSKKYYLACDNPKNPKRVPSEGEIPNFTDNALTHCDYSSVSWTGNRMLHVGRCTDGNMTMAYDLDYNKSCKIGDYVDYKNFNLSCVSSPRAEDYSPFEFTNRAIEKCYTSDALFSRGIINVQCLPAGTSKPVSLSINYAQQCKTGDYVDYAGSGSLLCQARPVQAGGPMPKFTTRAEKYCLTKADSSLLTWEKDILKMQCIPNGDYIPLPLSINYTQQCRAADYIDYVGYGSLLGCSRTKD